MAHQLVNIGEYSVFMEETNSTNDALKLLFSAESIPEGTVVHTHFQTRGRGQQNSVWESDRGENLLLSTLLQPHFLLADEQIWINVIISLALRETVEELANSPAKIKWPNDIYMGDKKIAGILIENVLQGHRIRYSIIGMGVNLNQQKFVSPTAASIAMLTHIPVDPKQARLKLNEKMTHYYALLKSKQYTLLWDQYHLHLLGKGGKARFKKDEILFDAEIMGIDKKGRLHLMLGDDIKSFAHKEIEFIQLL